MTDQDYWNKFVRTGNVYDYLQYTACTKEDRYGLADKTKEGGPNSGEDKSDRNGTKDNVYW